MARALTRVVTVAIAGATLWACSGATQTRHVTLALDAANDRPRTQFYPDTETFYCNVDFVGQRRNTTVDIFLRQTKAEATWGGPLQDVNYLLAGKEFAPQPGSSILSVQIEHPEPPKNVQVEGVLPYPVGEFRCEVVVEGVLEAVQPFKIVYAPCPGLAAVPGAGCREIYPPNSKCPAINQKITCTCGATSGVWEC